MLMDGTKEVGDVHTTVLLLVKVDCSDWLTNRPNAMPVYRICGDGASVRIPICALGDTYAELSIGINRYSFSSFSC
jgi:hypothetical protein